MSDAKIIVGLDGSDRAQDALVLARELARVLNCRLELVCAYSYSTPYAVVAYGALGKKDFEEDIERPAQDALRAVADVMGEETAARTVRASSPPHGLDQVAREQEAEMIVVGSTHRGPLGRITPGSVAERLLAGAPCAVAVPPAGFAAAPPHAFRVVGAAFDGSPEAARPCGLRHESRPVHERRCASSPPSSSWRRRTPSTWRRSLPHLPLTSFSSAPTGESTPPSSSWTSTDRSSAASSSAGPREDPP